MADDASVLHYLVRIGIMDDGHVSDGMTYLDWKEAYYSLHGAKTTTYGDKAGQASREDKASKYLLIIRSLKDKQRWIDNSLNISPMTQSGRDYAYSERAKFISAYDTLGVLINNANDIVKNACAIHHPAVL